MPSLREHAHLNISAYQSHSPPKDEVTQGFFDPSIGKAFTSSYSLRTISAGCYFFDPSQQAWVANGVRVSTKYNNGERNEKKER